MGSYLRRYLAGLSVLLLTTSLASAYGPPGYYGRYPQQPYYPGGWGYPQGAQPGAPTQPAAPSERQRPAPQGSTPWSPWGGYGQPSSQPPTTAKLPTARVSVNQTRPYVQQTTVVTLTVEDSDLLRTIAVEPPGSNQLVFSPLAKDKTFTNEQGKTVTQYFFAMTALQPGAMNLPSIHVSGKLRNLAGPPGWGGGQERQVEIPVENRIALTVQPADDSVRPWLPLNHLQIKAELLNAENPKAGNPLTLKVELSARGASGQQLPSVRPYLKSDQFKLYPEQTEETGLLSDKGRVLTGEKTESFILVPLYGGHLIVPDIRIAWWDVDQRRAAVAATPKLGIYVQGAERPSIVAGVVGGQSALFSMRSPVLFWSTLLLVAAVMVLWLVWKTRRFAQESAIEEELEEDAAAAEQAVAPGVPCDAVAVCSRAAMAGYWRGLKERMFLLLPRSWRFRSCVRCVDDEQDPLQWGRNLRQMACRHLDLSPHSPMNELADAVCRQFPRADASRLQRLMAQFDASLYGGQAIDFPAWKREFKRQLRPVLMPALRRGGDAGRSSPLPPLNPLHPA